MSKDVNQLSEEAKKAAAAEGVKLAKNGLELADNSNHANTASATGNGNEQKEKSIVKDKIPPTYSPGYIPKSTSRSKAKDKGRSL
jgi:hypothetical protein